MNYKFVLKKDSLAFPRYKIFENRLSRIFKTRLKFYEKYIRLENSDFLKKSNTKINGNSNFHFVDFSIFRFSLIFVLKHFRFSGPKKIFHKCSIVSFKKIYSTDFQNFGIRKKLMSPSSRNIQSPFNEYLVQRPFGCL